MNPPSTSPTPAPRLVPHQVAPPAAGWAHAEGLWGGGGGEGVKRWRPHLGAIGAFLPAERMFADGSGRDGAGGAGRAVRTGGRKSRRERETAGPAGGTGPGRRCQALCGHLSPAQDRRAGRPTDPACLTSRRRGLKLERDHQIPPAETWLCSQGDSGPKPVSHPGLGVPSVKRGGPPTGGLGALPVGLEAWEGGTSPSSGKSCGGTRGHFSDWERGFPSDSAFCSPLL